MKKIFLFMTFLLCTAITFAQQDFWKQVNESSINKNLFANRFKPQSYRIFSLNEVSLKQKLASTPSERIVDVSQSGSFLSIPNSEGVIERFRVVDAPVMDPALSAKYPGINSYAGAGIDDPTATIRFSTGPDGFHGMIMSAKRKTVYIDPIDKKNNYYVVFSRADAINYQSTFHCLTEATAKPEIPNATTLQQRAADDGRLRTFRLALACTGEYANYLLNGTETTDAQRKSKVLAAMNTLLTRTNGIYERDFGVRMVLIANNDAIIYLNASTDPWSTEWNTKTQQTIDAVIGSANYDIGHLVHKEASASNNNGNAGCIGCVCKAGQKGSAFTSHVAPEGDPFVVDYTTHEMGHQFGANHTFTFSNETGTASQFEPGSGSTIMGYAGITGATDVQPHSDDYFHARSIEQVSDYIKSGTGGGVCAVVTVTGNTAPVPNGGGNFTIPKATPFTLTGSATDVNGDALTYTWEQMNAGTSTTTNPSTTATSGPLFRSRLYSASPSRTFPVLSSILDGTNGNQWEKLPGVARTLNFRMMVRDNHAGGGNTKDADVVITVNGTAGPFAVTAPNTAVSWAGNSSQTVTWSVNSTNLTPISCANVKISISTDGGNTFSTLVASTPNDGSEAVTIPNTASTTARIKVEAVGNIFFDISNVNFTITSGTGCVSPAGLTSSGITTTAATISWTAISGAVSYDVDYKLNSSATWTNAATATTTTSVNLSALTSGSLYDWRVRTNCTGGSSAFSQAQFTTTTASTCGTAFEPNETLATAAAITAGATNSAAITTTTDIDYFKVVTTAASNNTFSLVGPGGVDYDMTIYNSAGTQIGSGTSGTATETVSLTNQAAGTYYIKVFGYNGANSTTCYTIKATTTVVTGCASALDNSTNGTTAGAATIPFNTNVTGLISPTGDVDHYKFVITTGGTITVTLTTLPADYDVKLLNSAGTQVAISQNGSTTSESISYTAVAGTYYVQIYGYNGANSASSCYTAKVTLGTASRNQEIVVPDGTIKISMFPNPARQVLNINIAGTTERKTIHVFDANGRVVITRAVTEGTTPLDISKLPAGMYFLKITSADGTTIHQEKFVKE